MVKCVNARPDPFDSHTAGSGKPGEIAITLGFGIPWDNEHLLHIGTLDGRFDSVYSE